MSAETSDILRIFVRDCHVDLTIGLEESEKGRKQPIIVNVECEAALICRFDGIEEPLDNTVDYSLIYNFIRTELPKLGHIGLLESAAEQIASFCLRDPRVRKVQVRIEKPTIFPDASAGIELVRTRS